MWNFFREAQEKRVKDLLEQARTNRDAYNSAISLLKTLNKDPKNQVLVMRGIELVRKIVWPQEKENYAHSQAQVEDLSVTLEKLGDLDYRVVKYHNPDNINKS